ncbi:MAG: helix-hairpin-helix domain-containing protein [Thermoplasmatota archaeon]
MPEDTDIDQSKKTDIEDKIDKEEMVSFLSSVSRISEDLARSLYDQGLDNWSSLIEGTEASFRKFKGIGPAKAMALVELGKSKMTELEESRPGLKEVLESIPRMNQRIISSLLDSGYDSVESFKETTEEDLQKINGIGPKMSSAIMEAVSAHLEKYGPDASPSRPVEEATAEVLAEEEQPSAGDERSLIQRIIDAIGGFFGGKKEENEEESAPGEAEGEKEGPQETSPEEEETPETVPPAEKESEDEPEEETPGEEKEPETQPVEASAEDDTPSETEEPETAPKEAVEEPPGEEPTGKMSFMERIKQMLFGSSSEKDDKPEETPTEEESSAAEEGQGKSAETSSKEEHLDESEPEASGEVVKEKVEPKEKKEYTEFEAIPGVSGKIAEALTKAGYLSIDELKEAVPEDLEMIEGIGPKTAEKIYKALKE